MKYIILTLTLVSFGSTVFGADKINKRIKANPIGIQAAVTNPAKVPVNGICGFDYLPNEVALKIPGYLIDSQLPISSAQDLISLSRTSKHFYALTNDTSIISRIENPVTLTLTNPRLLHKKMQTLSYENKLRFLTEISKIEINIIRDALLRRIVNLSLPLFNKVTNHTLIYDAIRESDLVLFESCQKIFNAYPVSPLDLHATTEDQISLHNLRATARQAIKQIDDSFRQNPPENDQRFKERKERGKRARAILKKLNP